MLTNRQDEINSILGIQEQTQPILVKEIRDIRGYILSEGDTVFFPAGRDLMKGVIKKIRHNRYNSEAYVENESGYKKWKFSYALIKDV